MKKDKKYTEVSELGALGLIERLTKPFKSVNSSSVIGVGDDAAVIDGGDGTNYTLLSTDLLLEGVHFDLVYFPLRHLGYKAVVVGISDILAMNGTATQITISLGVSAKFSVEQLEELYSGVRVACEEYRVDLVGGDTTASVNGLMIAVSVVGYVDKKKIAYRGGAKNNDLICITGNLGGAYMGLHLLEREKRVLSGDGSPSPKFEGHEYILRKQLMPEARVDVVEMLAKERIVPTAMSDISKGLASNLLQICRSSDCGARIYLDKLPIASETYTMAEELNSDPVTAALNGGDDHELIFTLPLELQEKVAELPGIEVIGHITASGTGTILAMPDGSEIAVTAPGIG